MLVWPCELNLYGIRGSRNIFSPMLEEGTLWKKNERCFWNSSFLQMEAIFMLFIIWQLSIFAYGSHCRSWAPIEDWRKCTKFSNWSQNGSISMLHCMDSNSCYLMASSFHWPPWHMQRGRCNPRLCRAQLCVCGQLCFWSSCMLPPNKQRKGMCVSSTF